MAQIFGVRTNWVAAKAHTPGTNPVEAQLIAGWFWYTFKISGINLTEKIIIMMTYGHPKSKERELGKSKLDFIYYTFFLIHGHIFPDQWCESKLHICGNYFIASSEIYYL